jgi:hypothetical protein
MSIRDEISRLIVKKIVIRHRSPEEDNGHAGRCLICRRTILLPAGALCLAIGDEGLVCRVCGNTYAPDMILALGKQQPITHELENGGASGVVMSQKWKTVYSELEALAGISDELAKGIARGIVEAPAGHIGLMHYAKDIQKPQRKPGEPEKDYDLRVRTFRMTKLYEIIRKDTTGRIEFLRELLQKESASK